MIPDILKGSWHPMKKKNVLFLKYYDRTNPLITDVTSATEQLENEKTEQQKNCYKKSTRMLLSKECTVWRNSLLSWRQWKWLKSRNAVSTFD